MLTIDFQNENLVARYGDREIIASVPDLITIVEQDSGKVLSTETVKYGCRIAVLLLPAPERMTTPKALNRVRPQAFGYDHYHYAPLSDRTRDLSVWDVFHGK